MSESKHVWVFLETEDGQLRSVGLELLGQGRLLADKMGEQLVGVILDPHAGTLAAQAIGCGADTVITMEDPALAHYNTDIFTAAMCHLVRKYAPEVLMIGATNVGRDLGPRISCRLHTGLTADCTHLDVDAHRCVLWTRPAFGGNLMATNICPDTKPQMGTVRPNVFRAPAFDPARTGAVFVESLPEDARRSSTELLELIPVLDAATANLTEAQIIVSGGRGMKGPENFALLQELADALPENWLVYQCIATADGTTALTYARDNSMRSLLLDKIARSELIVFNRAEAVNNDEARQELHKLVRQASRKCDIAYEFADGSVAYDDIPDPLPFDVNAPVIDIHDDDFGIWYMDCQDEPQKYTGKTVKFLAQVCQTNRAGKNSFVPGRFAMTCCVQDIQFVGFPCSYDGYKALEQRSWVRVTAKVSYKFHNIYRGKGPVLTAISVEPAEKPLNEVVTFS